MSDRFEGGFRLTGARCQAEFPILNVAAAAEPLVRPRKNEQAGTAVGERRAYLPFQGNRLSRLAVAQAVQTHLGHDERAFAGEILESGEISLQFILRFEINVK